LFGRNTPGGVVKFNSVRPESDFGGYASLSEATYNTANFEGAINFGLGEKWAARVSGLYQHRDDFVSNSLTGDDDIYEGYNDRAVRAQLEYDGDEFTALFNVHARNLDGTARLFRANIIQSGNNELVPGFDSDTISIDGQNRQELDILGGSVQLRWDFGAVALYSITGYESLEAYSRGDIDGGYGCGFCGIPNGPGFVPFPSETADGIPTLDQFTQEVRLESQSTGALKWQAGFYYFDESYDTEFFSYDSVFAGGAQTQYLRSIQDNTAWAVFGSINYAFSDAFEMRAGVRYTNDEKDFANDIPVGFTYPDPSLPTYASLSDDDVSWDLSGTWAVSDAVNLYARIATGFRGASVQPAGPFGNQSVAEPETNTSYEVGVKADLMDRAASIYFNIFHYEVKDQQLTAVGGASNAVRLLNADKTVGQGAELDVQAYLTPNLLVTLGASYNDTEIQDDGISVGTCFACTVTDPVVGGLAVIDGNPLPQAPELITNLTLRYGIPIGSGELYFHTDWSYRSDVNFFLYESTEFTGQDLLEGGIRVGYSWSEGTYEGAVFGRNITDEEVAVGAIDFNNLTGFLNEPQIWGVQFMAKF
jgi:iron complex outermembrane receptor protein